MINKTDIQWPIDNLPKTCIYSLDTDHYSQFYEVDEKCLCGCDLWLISTINVSVYENQFSLPPRRILRCKSCNKMRISKLKNKYEKIIISSSSTLKAFLKISNKEDCWYLLKNMLANLEIIMKSENLNVFKEQKIMHVEKHCEENNIDHMLAHENIKNVSQDITKKHAYI